MQRHGASFSCALPDGKLEWLLLLLLLAQIAIVFYGSARQTLGWDGLLVWEIKARFAFLSGGHLPAQYFSEPGRAFSHPEYPLAIPFTQLWIYLCLGEANQFWAKAIFPVFYVVGATLLALFGTRLTGKRTIGYLLALLLFFIPQVTIAAGGALTGYADFPLAAFYLATIGYLLCAVSESDQQSFPIYALCLALLPWVKKEGTILWAIAALAGALVLIKQRRSWRWWLALLPGFALICGWNLFLLVHRVAAPADFGSVNFHELIVHADRIAPIFHSVAREMINTSRWGIFWLLVGLALCYGIINRHRLRAILLLLTVTVPITIYSSLYLFSGWPVYLNHLQSSLPRLLLQVTPLAWLMIGLAMSQRRGSSYRSGSSDYAPPQS
ncbi:MAG: hypothetical protein M3R59_06615 [Verrucomicrobiota bacterium]|nr:hypothetical protein [Verrucomicrobiota bacterium]